MIELYDLRADYFQKAVSPLPSLSQPYIACCCIYPLIKAYLFWWTSLLSSRTRFVFFFLAAHLHNDRNYLCDRESAIVYIVAFYFGAHFNWAPASSCLCRCNSNSMYDPRGVGVVWRSAAKRRREETAATTTKTSHCKAASHRSEKYFASMFELLLSLARSLTLSPICCVLSRSNSLLRAARSLNPRSRN